jgi:hypothetical protein
MWSRKRYVSKTRLRNKRDRKFLGSFLSLFFKGKTTLQKENYVVYYIHSKRKGDKIRRKDRKFFHLSSVGKFSTFISFKKEEICWL